MTLVAVAGARCTTTALGLVAAWPSEPRPVLVELDPDGGSAAAWLGLPRQPGLSEIVASGDPGRWSVIAPRVQLSAAGVAAIVAPVRTVEAGASVAAAAPLVAQLARRDDVFVADIGRFPGQLGPSATQAAAVLLSHVQHSGSAPAAALGLERLADQCATLAMRSLPTVVALHGTWPYAADEVKEFLDLPNVLVVDDDPWAAAVIAGRPGSLHRLQRSKWWASMERIAAALAALTAPAAEVSFHV